MMVVFLPTHESRSLYDITKTLVRVHATPIPKPEQPPPRGWFYSKWRPTPHKKNGGAFAGSVFLLHFCFWLFCEFMRLQRAFLPILLKSSPRF
jgi:hypothetical protein